MLQLPSVFTPPIFGDELVLRSIDWLENFPWRQENTVKSDDDKYEIRLNVKDYTPEEISVKTSDGFIVVEAKHDEKKDDYGYISRQFIRRYRIPDGCPLESVKSKLTSDGNLFISAPRNPAIKQDMVIPVKHECANRSKL